MTERDGRQKSKEAACLKVSIWWNVWKLSRTVKQRLTSAPPAADSCDVLDSWDVQSCHAVASTPTAVSGYSWKRWTLADSGIHWLGSIHLYAKEKALSFSSLQNVYKLIAKDESKHIKALQGRCQNDMSKMWKRSDNTIDQNLTEKSPLFYLT